jgi:hypothetical protein
MTERSEDALKALGERLTDSERALLLGECDSWGSWMFDAGEHLCSLDLGTKRDGSIAFDTPLVEQLRTALRGDREQGEG